MKRAVLVLIALVMLFALVPTAQATALPEAEPFSIVWLSDTQNMVYHNFPNALASMGKWISENRHSENIKYVVQTGDMVDNGFCEWQWKNFDQLYSEFAGKVPYIAVAGNHELHVKYQQWWAYLERPQVSSIPRVNTYERGKAVYATFEANGQKFIIIGAGFGAEVEAADWMNSVLKYHRDYTAILIFHGYLKSRYEYLREGQKMFDLVVKPNPNVRLVLCGHVNGTAVKFEDLDDDGDGVADRRVTAMLYNYQDWAQDCGQMRLLTFNADRSITVTTFSPFTGKTYRDDTYHADTFTIDGAY